MLRLFGAILFLFFCCETKVCAEKPFSPYCRSDAEDYFRDIEIARQIDACTNFRYPITYNFAANVGYFICPSARTAENGTIAVGWANQPPYTFSNVAIQLTRHLELSLNYRIFKGVEDPILSKHGFGDLSDKGANAKIAVVLPEDSDYRFPGIAIGFEDFIGTQSFNSRYLVATQVFVDANLECSLGYGSDRLKGFFGGVSWLPFRCSSSRLISSIQLCAEYDPVDYEDPAIEHHPDGRNTSSPINFGMKWEPLQGFEFSVARIRGEELAGSVSVSYNLGESEGMLPKIYDSLPYSAPCDVEPVGLTRSEEVMVEDFCLAFSEQGFALVESWLGQDSCNRRVLRLVVCNGKYRRLCDQRERLTAVVTHLTPSNLDKVIVVVQDFGLPIHEYHFSEANLCRKRNGEMSDYQLAILSPLTEVSSPDRLCDTQIFRNGSRMWKFYVYPDFDTLWGSAKGKLKYSIGLNFGMMGYLTTNTIYMLDLYYSLFSDMDDVGSVDMLNPSQLVNVRSDSILYRQASDLQLRSGFLQSNFNLGCGFYSRLAGGYLEQAYGGLAAELLWYPVWSDLAIGVEGAFLRKRNYSGLGFTDKFRQFTLWTPRYVDFTPYQYFLNVYYDWRWAQLDWKLTVGQFVLHDIGWRVQIGRYFNSGFRVFGWYAQTSAKDYINGSRYYDKGVGFTIYPEILFGYSCRRQIGYSLHAWNRDIAIEAGSGIHLYDVIREQRRE